LAPIIPDQLARHHSSVIRISLLRIPNCAPDSTLISRPRNMPSLLTA